MKNISLQLSTEVNREESSASQNKGQSIVTEQNGRRYGAEGGRENTVGKWPEQETGKKFI